MPAWVAVKGEENNTTEVTFLLMFHTWAGNLAFSEKNMAATERDGQYEEGLRLTWRSQKVNILCLTVDEAAYHIY